MQTRPKSLIESSKRKLRSFIADYRRYRTGHVLVYRLGRWESFCRAMEWAIKGKK